MSLLPLRSWPARSHEELPSAPGPFPAPQPSLPATVIFVVVTGAVMWLLAHRYSVRTAMGVVAGTGMLAAAIASWLASTQPADQ